jgi:O-antigen ligase
MLALFLREFRLTLKHPELVLFIAFGLWTLLVVMIEGADNTLGKSKVVLYVASTLMGVLLAAQNSKWRLESILLWASCIGGLGAGASWLFFYAGPPQPDGARLIAIGLWDTAIMAAHAVGGLVILALGLLPIKRIGWKALALLSIPLTGYALFLSFNQTRGVWAALLVCMLVMTLLKPSRQSACLALLITLCLAIFAALDPGILVQRGLSFRPELWRAGADLLMQHWGTGLGFNTYVITIPEVGSFKHPHNLFLDTGVRLGVPGLVLFCVLWTTVGWRGWVSRAEPLGRTLLALWVFSSVCLMTDGIGLWLKPNADWLITWLPVSLSLVLAHRGAIKRGPISER